MSEQQSALTRLLDWAAGQVAVMRTSYATGEDGWICDEEIREEVKQVEADIAALSDEDAGGGYDKHLHGCLACGRWGRDDNGRLMCCCPPDQYARFHPDDTPPQQRDALEALDDVIDCLSMDAWEGEIEGYGHCKNGPQILMEKLRLVRHALTNPAVPEGWKLVPVEPSDDWAERYCWAVGEHPDGEQGSMNSDGLSVISFRELRKNHIAAMLAAAPEPGAEKNDG